MCEPYGVGGLVRRLRPQNDGEAAPRTTRCNRRSRCRTGVARSAGSTRAAWRLAPPAHTEVSDEPAAAATSPAARVQECGGDASQVDPRRLGRARRRGGRHRQRLGPQDSVKGGRAEDLRRPRRGAGSARPTAARAAPAEGRRTAPLQAIRGSASAARSHSSALTTTRCARMVSSSWALSPGVANAKLTRRSTASGRQKRPPTGSLSRRSTPHMPSAVTRTTRVRGQRFVRRRVLGSRVQIPLGPISMMRMYEPRSALPCFTATNSSTSLRSDHLDWRTMCAASAIAALRSASRCTKAVASRYWTGAADVSARSNIE
mmetsp:Transcript_41484/g.137950  ORF Transcript_41484/g.137950 Transcript_41484/m.137950 type:complete len:317 (+) Transcript_41484:86-1036(+)